MKNKGRWLQKVSIEKLDYQIISGKMAKNLKLGSFYLF